MSGTHFERGDERGASSWAGVVAVAAAYVFFLLYAQFAFLKLLQARLGAGGVESAMAAMGLAGLGASLATGALLARIESRRWLVAGFVGCGATALLALGAWSSVALTVVAAAIGTWTAVTTVALAADLRALAPGRRFGLPVGLGTGIAYLVCNLPPLFEGGAVTQSVAAAVACGLGLLAVTRSRRGREAAPKYPEAGGACPTGSPSSSPSSTAGSAGVSPAPPSTPWTLDPADYTGWGFAAILLSFLALIWLDSTAFAVIQETAALKGQTWGTAGQKLIQGGIHALAAVVAGWLIDRGFLRGLLPVTFGLFAAAFLTFDGSAIPWWAGPVYAVGISLYSVALVAYPSSAADGSGIPRRWRAALVFGVAGWLGSALGVGMAQSLHRVPRSFLAAAGLLILTAWAVRAGGPRMRRWIGLTGQAARVHAVTLALGGVALLVYALHAARPDAALAMIERGRRVYVGEGCIHCHSQYIRPHSRDVELWGPHQATSAPPLYGNRRQGPDLSNAGARRSAAWHRLHLADPRALEPTSRMPSYAYLFDERGKGDDGASRGDDLVAYLASLGNETSTEWYEMTRRTHVGDLLADGSSARGAAIFDRHCAPCHGPEGRGDGPLAAGLAHPAPPPRAMNLRKGPLWLVSWGPDAPPVDESLAQLIRYGMPGTSMPGHETLDDREVADLVAYVQVLAASPIAEDSARSAGADDAWLQ